MTEQQNRDRRTAAKSQIKRIALALLALVLTLCALSSCAQDSYYQQLVVQQQQQIQQLEALNQQLQEQGSAYGELALISAIFEQFGYYSGKIPQEEMIDEILKAYARATGDDYAEYYTYEEYKSMETESQGDYEGIGVSVVQTTLAVDGYEHQVFQVISVFKDAPAQNAGVLVGDCVYAVKVDGEYKTVASLGYTGALAEIRGEKGTKAEFLALRKDAQGTYRTVEFSVVRDECTAEVVTHKVSETDPGVGIVHISSFDLATPIQFKTAVNELLSLGVEHFIFDLRNNPGGDLQSIKAILTYFLNEGDLILSAIDRNGQKADSYYAEVIQWTDPLYSACNVSKDEIGMYADLDMVVLCNGNTASAAEVFTATMRDYGLAKIVGETTFGKGIMQSILPLSRYGNFDGYFKFTSFAYVTKCGIPYQDIGIAPDEGLEVSLSEEAMNYNIYMLPEALDDQLLLAIAQFAD